MCHTIPLLKFFKIIVEKQQKNVPACSMWLKRVFADLANTDEQHRLTIDYSGVNKNRWGRYRPLELKQMIQKNRVAILIHPAMMSYTMFSHAIG